MSDAVLILGGSGAGKSTAVRTLDPKETFIINVIDKPLPFKGWKSKYPKYSTSNKDGNMVCHYEPEKILQTMDYVNKQSNCKVLVLDDFQYVMSYMLMAKRNEKGYDKFIQIAGGAFDILKKTKEMREDLTVFLLTHSEISLTDGQVAIKMKTIGKMLDEKICPEGLFSVVLLAQAKKNFQKEITYTFTTQTDGTTTAKSPIGMFADLEIPNDLQAVYNAIQKYNGEE